jgi:hypothetical protein
MVHITEICDALGPNSDSLLDYTTIWKYEYGSVTARFGAAIPAVWPRSTRQHVSREPLSLIVLLLSVRKQLKQLKLPN